MVKPDFTDTAIRMNTIVVTAGRVPSTGGPSGSAVVRIIDTDRRNQIDIPRTRQCTLTKYYITVVVVGYAFIMADVFLTASDNYHFPENINLINLASLTCKTFAYLAFIVSTVNRLWCEPSD